MAHSKFKNKYSVNHIIAKDEIIENQVKSPKKMEIYSMGVVMSCNQNFQKIEIFENFSKGLKGIENSQHLWVLYWLHKISRNQRKMLQVHPMGNLTQPKRGVFTTHSPARPNPIGLTKVKLVKKEGNVLIVQGLDAFEGSPVLDIKSF